MFDFYTGKQSNEIKTRFGRWYVKKLNVPKLQENLRTQQLATGGKKRLRSFGLSILEKQARRISLAEIQLLWESFNGAKNASQ